MTNRTKEENELKLWREKCERLDKLPSGKILKIGVTDYIETVFDLINECEYVRQSPKGIKEGWIKEFLTLDWSDNEKKIVERTYDFIEAYDGIERVREEFFQTTGERPTDKDLAGMFEIADYTYNKAKIEVRLRKFARDAGFGITITNV